jgi:DNA-binding CsgD family transcriptional regulator
MLHDLLLDIISKGRISDIALLLGCILSFVISWFTVLLLGLKILKVKVKSKNIILYALLGASVAGFIKPFLPNPLPFLAVIIPLFLSLKILSNAKWVTVSWVTLILLLVNTIGPWLFINPLSSVNHNIGSFFFENKFGMLVLALIETFGAVLLLVILNIFDISLTPQTNHHSFIDFTAVFIFTALFYQCHRLTVDICKKPEQFMLQPVFDWTLSAATMVGFYLLVINYKKREQKKDEKYRQLEESKLDTQTVETYCKLIINSINNPSNNPLNDIALEFGDLLDIYFSRRERDVLHLLAQGKDNNEIAETLYLAPGTVANLVNIIKSKAQVPDRNRLLLYAMCWVRQHKDKPVKKPKSLRVRAGETL